MLCFREFSQNESTVFVSACQLLCWLHLPYRSGGYKVTTKFISEPLTLATASKAEGHNTVCAFVNDDLSEKVLEELGRLGVKVLAMRCAVSVPWLSP